MYQQIMLEWPILGNWLFPTILYVLIGYGAFRLLQKKIIGDVPEVVQNIRNTSPVFFTKRLFLQFWGAFVAAIIVVVVRMCFGAQFSFGWEALIIFAVGFFNYFGAYNQ